ncbi:Acetyl esterase Axe7A precursor [Poriferisphaera corsica]|uniref:Acetyl esterase Axe7A n=1 Tax=Poriferisphaera corsica TaxID=2528020 RepID=A0A517YPW2_9BACT|nr:acetylxylan esterase [Poriferisphaera corsica]QDU32267.1 Acetyl esterase Axe7A precursor [Poriferisphaera corsica]
MHAKFLNRSLLFLLLTLCVAAQSAIADTLRLDASCTKPDAIYQTNEPITFRIKLLNQNDAALTGRKIQYTLSLDGYETIRTGTFTTTSKPSLIRTRLDKPGFVRLELTYKPINADNTKQTKVFKRLAAGINPTQIPATAKLPKDFNQFWQSKIQTVRNATMTPVLTPVEFEDSNILAFDLQIQTPGSTTSTSPLSGYYAKPANAKPKSHPAILIPHSAGVRSSRIPAYYASLGFIALDFNAHGLPNGKPASFYQEQTNGPLKGYPAFGKTNPNDSYFTGMYMRLIRALEFIKAQPEWDGKILVVKGSSQGGGQALIAGGLDPDITLICASVPAMSDHAGYEAGKMVGWPRLASWNKPNDSEKDITYRSTIDASRYVDAANFAALIQAQTLISVGFADHVCCPTSVYTAFNNIPHKNKRIINRPLMGHSFPQDLQAEFDQTIMQHVKDMQ